MSDRLTFDELLDLGRVKGPIAYQVKAWGGREIYVRDPSSADVDEWRMYCNRHKDSTTPVPFAAKLVQIMLCDDEGNRIVPQDEEALEALAATDAAGIDEISRFCMPIVNGVTDDEIEAIEKN